MTAITVGLDRKILNSVISCIVGAENVSASFIAGKSKGKKDEIKENKSIYIIDTDAGIDDAIAILYALETEKLYGNIKVIGITCVNGNTNVDNVAINVLKTLKTASRLDIPVFKGAQDALLVNLKSSDYFGKDGLGDFDFPDPPPLSLIRKQHAVNALVKIAREYPGKLNIICLGPMTNIAMATRIYPDFLKNVKDLFVLGSSTEGIGNVKPGIEFNFYSDPESAFVVFKKRQELNKTITLMPLETAVVRGRIPMEWRKKVFGTVESQAVDFINKAEEKFLENLDFWCQVDPMLMAASLNDSIITSFEMHPLLIEVCGVHSRGAAFVDYDTASEMSFVKIVKEIDMEKYKNMLVDRFK